MKHVDEAALEILYIPSGEMFSLVWKKCYFIVIICLGGLQRIFV